MSGGLSQKAFQGIAAGIGLVSESITAHKAKKQNRSSPEEQRSDRRSSVQSNGSPVSELPGYEAAQPAVADPLEEQWALDEAQEELLHASSPEHLNTPENVRESEQRVGEGNLAQGFVSVYPAPPPYTLDESISTPRLSLPVVLPQRRPKARDRGFIRAYAPALADCGIDQAMFLDFLDTAEKSCQATPWLHAINLASIGTMWMPSVSGMAVSIAIQIATDIAIAADGRRKTNSFFDKINREFFQPRGLYCLIMTWNPELPDCPSTTFDLDSFISSSANGGGSNMFGRLRHKFKSSDGKTYGNIFPEVAPLVFPQIDELASDQDAQKKLSKMKQRKEFVSSYMDKRAQAKFIAKNPDSHLNQGPTPTFTSRYADPNHPASSGDPLALVTGGYFTTEKLQALRGGSGGPGGLRGRRGHASYGTQDPRYEDQEPYSNPPAPYGRPLSRRGIISTISELRSRQDISQTAPRDGYGPSYNDMSRNGGRRGLARDRQNNIGPLTPIAKLLKKVSNLLAFDIGLGY
ncbi:uncharacterized protein N7459_007729 [Penicillium hispanicum]|uniref:uncharacterized protein n=1 Tax=Penicillium hispanicum TaxID=1080232 RepID=UPI002541C3FF|nr:uncharacterized protein N7459_007729 [Penicillium hispanicum]KAJ5578765.1 hypothetical protein N7459_007729 [Penicillium hispanicum]